MDRFIALLVLLTITGCGGINTDKVPEDEYIFHDDFYYNSYVDGGKSYLTPCVDQHYIRFRTKGQKEVIDELLMRGFTLLSDPAVQNYACTDGFALPDEIKYASVVLVEGVGRIDDIPDVIYSHHLYSENGSLFGKSNLLSVYYDVSDPESQVERILQYAKMHSIYPIYHFPDMGLIVLECVNASSGNPVELANWFVEAGGFVQSFPDSGYTGNAAGKSQLLPMNLWKTSGVK